MNSEKSRRNDRILTSAVILSIATYFAARLLLEIPTLAQPLRLAIALAPVPFFVFLLISWLRSIRKMDELEQRIQLEALGIAFPVAMVLLMTLGLIELATPLSPADWSYRHVWQICLVLYFLGLTTARRRYQ